MKDIRKCIMADVKEPIWDSLYQGLQQFTAIPSEEWRVFQSLSTLQHVAKHSYVVRAGEHTESIGLCVSGLFRMYYTTPNGDEFNKSFCAKDEFVASYSALLLNSSSFFSIEALMDSELVVINYKDFRSLYERHVCWERLGRLIVEQLFVKKEFRERELLTLSAEERYLLFLDKYGQLAASIPQFHIASYLGITPVALSRIRRKINNY